MAGGKNKLGEGTFDLRADATQMKKDLEDARKTAETETEKIGDAVDKNVTTSFNNAGKSVSGIGKKAIDSVSKLTSALGAVTAVVGVFTLALKVGGAIGDRVFGNWRKELVKIRSEFELLSNVAKAKSLEDVAISVSNVTSKLEVVNAEIQNYKNLIESGAPNIANFMFDIDLLEKEQSNLRGTIRVLSVKAKKIKEVNEALKEQEEVEKKLADIAAQKARHDQVKNENNQLEIDALEGIEKVARVREKRKLAVISRIEKETNKSVKRQLERQLDLIDRAADRQIKSLKNADQVARDLFDQRKKDEERKAIESAQRQADAMERALTNALKRVRGEQATDSGVVASIQELGRKLDASIQSTKFGSGG